MQGYRGIYKRIGALFDAGLGIGQGSLFEPNRVIKYNKASKRK